MSESRARVAFYGDDFTGSVDVLLQFARFGWTGRLFVGLPDDDALSTAATEADVVGVAGIARSLETAQLEAELVPAFAALARLQTPIVQYKACSTADSSPRIGSLGRVIELARERWGTAPIPLVFAQPDFGRYTVFGHHFAREGDRVYRLDRQPTMSAHPRTPMTESDLVRHLSAQTELPLAGLDYRDYPDGPDDGARLAAQLGRTSAAAVLLDARDEQDIARIGRAVRELNRPAFVLGSGGLSSGIAQAWAAPPAALPRAGRRGGPVLAVSGSRSPATARQLDRAAQSGWLVTELPQRAADTDEILRALAEGRHVAATSRALTGSGADVLSTVAERGAALIGAALERGRTGRIVVCGGDTSSRVTSLLGVRSLSLAANPWENVVLLRAHAEDPRVDGVELFLKGGQVGDDDLLVALADGPV